MLDHSSIGDAAWSGDLVPAVYWYGGGRNLQ